MIILLLSAFCVSHCWSLCGCKIPMPTNGIPIKFINFLCSRPLNSTAQVLCNCYYLFVFNFLLSSRISSNRYRIYMYIYTNRVIEPSHRRRIPKLWVEQWMKEKNPDFYSKCKLTICYNSENPIVIHVDNVAVDHELVTLANCRCFQLRRALLERNFYYYYYCFVYGTTQQHYIHQIRSKERSVQNAAENVHIIMYKHCLLMYQCISVSKLDTKKEL